MSSRCSSAKRADRGDELERGARVVAHRAGTARRARRGVAARDGTGWPSASLWVGAYDDEKPRPPAASESCEQLHHRLELLVGRRLADVRLAHHDAAERGVADQEAGVHREACRRGGRGTRRSSASPTARPPRSDSSGMPSTRASMRMR